LWKGSRGPDKYTPNRLLVEVLLSEAKRTPGKRSHRREDNTKINRKEEHYNDVDWSKLVQVRVQWQVFAKTVMNVMVD
jgi:hypothetical protein